MTIAALIALTALLASAVWSALGPAPWLFPAGLALAALAPLVYIAAHLVAARTELGAHPVLVSITSAVGCVGTMFGVQRFGENEQWTVWAALAALVIWTVWQRRERQHSHSRGDQATSPERK